MATQNSKPATAFRSGNVNVAVWENTGETGPFFSITFSRPYEGRAGQLEEFLFLRPERPRLPVFSR